MRWYELQAIDRCAALSPKDQEFYFALYWAIASRVYDFLLDGGILLLDEDGGYYRDCYIAPLGTPTRQEQCEAKLRKMGALK